MKANKVRRKYSEGVCSDCGWHKRVTPVTFWVNGYRQNYCADCIKMYRKAILLPSKEQNDRSVRHA